MMIMIRMGGFDDDNDMTMIVIVIWQWIKSHDYAGGDGWWS